MARPKFQTLTEQMYYVLLCLRQECYGMDIMERIPAMTDGREPYTTCWRNFSRRE